MKVDLQMRIEQISKGIVPPGYKKIKSHIVPCEWDVFPISEVCQVVSGGTPSTKKSEYWDGEIPWCTPTDITKSSKYISTTEKKITEEGLKNSSAVLLPKNSILMCSRATIGPRAINTVKMATNQGFKTFICNKTKLDYEFFYYLLEMYVPLFKKLGSGSTFLEISKKDVEETKIIIPVSIKEQKGIAEILSTWDKAIELKEKLIEQKKEQKKGFMQKLLTGEVRLSKNKENWKEEELEKVLENIVGGGTPSRKNPNYYNGGIPWATVKDMGNENYKDSTIENISLEGLKNSSAKLIEKNNLIISTRMGLGRCFINTVDMAINQDLKGLYPNKSKILVEYLMYYFKLKAEDLEKKGSGSTVKGITLSVLKKLKIYYPNLEAQQKIVDILSTVDKEIELLTKEVNHLKKQKKGLMQLLLTGKVRVKV